MNGKSKVLMAAGLAFALVGCGTVDGLVKSNVANSYKLAKDGSGVAYALVIAIADSSDKKTLAADIKSACDAVNNSDARCFEQSKYKVGYFATGFGFSAAASGVVVAAPIDMKLTRCNTGGGKGCTYAKVKAEPGKFGTILEVYQEGENGCHWAGMPRMGGVVCNDWDYRKDMRDWDTTNGVMTVKE